MISGRLAAGQERFKHWRADLLRTGITLGTIHRILDTSRILRFLALLVFTEFIIPANSVAGVRIVIDAAHGGNEPGSKAGSETEKDWNLKFARAIAKAAEATGYDAILIRTKEETIDLKDRIDRINAADSSLAIVIHVDRDFSGTRSGAQMILQPPSNAPDPVGLQPWGWIPSGRYRMSARLAKVLARELGISGAFSSLSDRTGCLNEPVSWEGRILCASHAHLRYLVPAAVVLTPMFLTSKTDLQNYSSDSAVEAFAGKVASALQVYFRSGSEENP